MKYIGLGIIIISAFAAGYLIGSTQNTGDSIQSVSPANANDRIDSTPSQHDTLKPAHVKVSNTSEGDIASIPSNKGGKREPALISQLDGSKNSALTARNNSETYPLAQQELDEWIATYKPRLKQDMIDALGQDVAEFMFEQITKENAFLNQPTANHYLEEDVSTRHDLEQAIRDFIGLNTIDPDTELLNAKCIQGRCEVTLTGMAQNAAIFIYMEINGNAIPALEGLKTPTLHVDPEKPEIGYWAYMLFQY